MSISVEVNRLINGANVRFSGEAATQEAALTLAIFLAASEQALDVKSDSKNYAASKNAEAKLVKEQAEAKKSTPAADTQADATASTEASPTQPANDSTAGAETDTRTFTAEEVTALITKYAAPTVADGRARMVAILQRNGLKVFRGVTDADVINNVGAMIVRTFEGDGSFDPREAA